MKVVWIILAVLFGLCLICAGGGYFLFSKAKGAFDEAGKSGDTAFSAIAASWDAKQFHAYAAPEFEEQTGNGPIEKLVDRYRDQFGTLKGPFTSHLTNISANSVNGVSKTSADWDAEANFEKGSGHVTMQLTQRGDKWEILTFHIAASGSDSNAEPRGDEPNIPR